MDCPICRDLRRAYETGLNEYIDAHSSASYGISTELAAFKNVEMERAKSELEEHRLGCVFAVRVYAFVGTGRVNDFEKTGGIVSCRSSSAVGPGLAVAAGDSFAG